ncbi:Kip1p [Cyberlindnera jadinii NRRL Y-1542]|uniref:Kinesin-like protein KIP1 n=1 Tax=Cyberlindnera jadinii (strain ATCC 18201 / CBS 1600 / BCRC 20928 / JCM 3617 / NBRC 0987 / NRRL Y-1542) TaxID=983966 RepID=A0A1E4S8Y3_CYBJN|nr:kinesin-domain-containing protein [Cyberlindnera jadinii NRRL Y-1542]ODV75944.1 kinesin-domain-containing protein [Cyberlindnera jadinii NRRL Y-1542]
MFNNQQGKRPRLSFDTKPHLSQLAVGKNARASIATSSPSKSKTYAQKTASSNQKSSNLASDQESNISVYVRCRSLNERELDENAGKVISTNGHMKKEVIVKSAREKTYTFDRVFGPESDQEMIYDGVAKPLLQEMLQGYNCTVFAYGQTGTGKTHTMSGDIQMSNNRIAENAGIIPRTLLDLFRSLEKNSEFTVKVSFIELYNEELRDLLITKDSEDRKVRIFDDPEKKSIVVQGMEEVFIKNVSEGMNVLMRGSYNRQVAATKCNDLSSRSHSVFAITVHMKEIDPISGEEYLKIGKLNLVDLAGSENISRSGAENKRAREAGMINQSLLTLGRVINALVDQSPHIPYRESKLTRLLQDSLGGRTKTCIIATISPSKASLDETVSTLEYANRAKSIKNKPQLNQTMSKKMMIKEYVQEIERLRNDLNATRDKNGVYVSDEHWDKIMSESENRKNQVDDQKLRIDVLEEKIRKSKKDFEDQMEYIKEVEDEIEIAKRERKISMEKLEECSTKLVSTERELKIEALWNKNLVETEKELADAYNLVNSTLQETISIREELYDRIAKKHDLEDENVISLETSKTHIISQTKIFTENASRLYDDNKILGAALNDGFQSFVNSHQSKIEKKCNGIKEIGHDMESLAGSSVNTLTNSSKEVSDLIGVSKLQNQEMHDSVTNEVSSLRSDVMNMAGDINKKIGEIDGILASGSVTLKSKVDENLKSVTKVLEEKDEIVVTATLATNEANHEIRSKLEDEIAELKRWKESEMENRQRSQNELMSQISSLISAHDIKAQQRFDEQLSSFIPKFDRITEKQSQMTSDLEKFIENKWKPTIRDSRAQVEDSFSCLKGDIEGNMKVDLGPINNAVVDIVHKQCLSFENISQELQTKTAALDECLSKVGTLVGSSCDITQGELLKLKSMIGESLGKIQAAFIKSGKAIESSKAQVVDTYLNRQDDFVKSYRDSTCVDVNNLNDYVNKVGYSRDDEPIPKRQKITVPTLQSLPRALSRQQIIAKHQTELDGQPQKKMPLSSIDVNSNVPDTDSKTAPPTETSQQMELH